MNLEYNYQNFYEIIENNAKKYGKKTIIFTQNSKLNNIQLKQRVDTFARFLELSGIKPKDKVALILNNSEYFIISLFAITKLGAIVVPINNFLKQEELEYILNDCGAKLLITSQTFEKELTGIFDNTNVEKAIWTDNYKKLDERNFCFYEIIKGDMAHEKLSYTPALDDTAIIVYTSGTTGNPKGAMLSFKNVLSNNTRGSITRKKNLELTPGGMCYGGKEKRGWRGIEPLTGCHCEA